MRVAAATRRRCRGWAVEYAPAPFPLPLLRCHTRCLSHTLYAPSLPLAQFLELCAHQPWLVSAFDKIVEHGEPLAPERETCGLYAALPTARTPLTVLSQPVSRPSAGCFARTGVRRKLRSEEVRLSTIFRTPISPLSRMVVSPGGRGRFRPCMCDLRPVDEVGSLLEEADSKKKHEA